jgi:hypothetical protein
VVEENKKQFTTERVLGMLKNLVLKWNKPKSLFQKSYWESTVISACPIVRNIIPQKLHNTRSSQMGTRKGGSGRITVTLAMEKNTEMPPRPSALKLKHFPILFLFLVVFHHKT